MSRSSSSFQQEGKSNHSTSEGCRSRKKKKIKSRRNYDEWMDNDQNKICKDTSNLSAKQSHEGAVKRRIYQKVQVPNFDTTKTRKAAEANEEFLKQLTQTEENLLSSFSDSLSYGFQELPEGYMITTATLATCQNMHFDEQNFKDIFRNQIKISSGSPPDSILKISAPFCLFDLNKIDFRSINAIMRELERINELNVANRGQGNTAACVPLDFFAPSQPQVYDHDYIFYNKRTPMWIQTDPNHINPNYGNPQSQRMHFDMFQPYPSLDIISRFENYCNIKSNGSLLKSTVGIPITNLHSQRYPDSQNLQLSRTHNNGASSHLGISKDEISRAIKRDNDKFSTIDKPLTTIPMNTVNNEISGNIKKDKSQFGAIGEHLASTSTKAVNNKINRTKKRGNDKFRTRDKPLTTIPMSSVNDEMSRNIRKDKDKFSAIGRHRATTSSTAVNNDGINKNIIGDKDQFNASDGHVATSSANAINERQNIDNLKNELDNDRVFKTRTNISCSPVARSRGNKGVLYSQVAASKKSNSSTYTRL